MARSYWGVSAVIFLVVLTLLVLSIERRQASERAEDPLHRLTDPTTDLATQHKALVAAGEWLRASDSPDFARRLLSVIPDLGYEQWSQLPHPLADDIVAWFAHQIEHQPIDVAAVMDLEALFAEGGSHPEWPALWAQWQQRIEPMHRRFDDFALAFDRLLADHANPHLDRDLSALRQRWLRLLQGNAQLRGLEYDRYVHRLAAERLDILANGWLLGPALAAIQTADRSELATVVTALSPAQGQALHLWTTMRFSLGDDGVAHAGMDAALRATQLASRNGMAWWWLLFLSGLGAVIVAWLAASAGPPTIDPSAETLENVDPIDLDTDAGTMSDPGTTTGDRTTVGESSYSDGDG